MSSLKSESLNKCLTVLKEYIDDVPADEKKRFAVLALDQLQKITAGKRGTLSDPSCNANPRANGSPY